ncbi:hypothetical protein C8Q70DRAFT_388161 [Cubamyces menziesii]|nr:hypothetical protein C8Q70DRAFT_388161 [Cubamyces menziesii]
MAITFVPPAPVLSGDATLEVFVYPAADRTLEPENKFCDTRRLACLGQVMAEAAYMDIMRQRYPASSGKDLQQMVDNQLENIMERAGEIYEWHKKVLGCPNDVDAKSPEECRRLFCTYAGAVNVQFGFNKLESWMRDILSFIN